MLRLLVALLIFAAGATCHPRLRLIPRQSSTSNSSSQVIDALSKANLTTLASFFTSHSAILTQAINSPGYKTMLAPDNRAIAAIPTW